MSFLRCFSMSCCEPKTNKEELDLIKMGHGKQITVPNQQCEVDRDSKNASDYEYKEVEVEQMYESDDEKVIPTKDIDI